MANTLAVANYLNCLHNEKHGSNMDQMKMHKMMYFSQRESLMINKTLLFDASFEAWKYGPVLVEVRNEYQTGNMFSGEYDPLLDEEKKLVEAVFDRYDGYSAWDLSTLSHSEYSWQQAREGLESQASSNRKLTVSAMKVDATKEFLRRQGVVLV